MTRISFTGRGKDLFGVFLRNAVFTLITLGIYFPWAKANFLRYMAGHIEINGEPFTFHGKGGELFWGLVKSTLVIILLTIPMYTALFLEKLNLFDIFFLLFVVGIVALTPFFVHGALRYMFSRLSWRGVRMVYTGEKMKLIKMYWVGFFLLLITFGIYGFWLDVKVLRYVYSNIRIGNISFDFTGNGKDLFWIWIKGVFLSLVTMGVYLPWFYVELKRFFISNTWVVQDERKEVISTTLRGGKILWFWLRYGFLLMVTLGIAMPWVVAEWTKLRVNSLVMEGDIDAQSLVQTSQEYADATGFGFLDLGEGLWGQVFRV